MVMEVNAGILMGKPASLEAPKGKLSYCQSCKDMTETILIKTSNGPLGKLLSKRSRICRACAKPKPWSELEE